MEHTNLFLFENESALETKYPNGNVDDVEPGVAYARPDQEEEDGTVYYNRMVTNYSITIHSRNKSGATLLEDRTIQTPKVLDGNTVKTNVVAEPVEGYKPRYAVEKVEFDSATTEHTITYLAATSYTVTLHHIFSGESLTGDTEIVLSDIFEEDVVRVHIVPEIVAGYAPITQPFYASISGDTEFTIEYEEACENYEFVDLGLPSGTLWATKNLGAETISDYGNTYAWAEIEGNKLEYEWSNYKWCDGTAEGITKYGEIDDKWMLEQSDDAAYFECCGGQAHVPTAEQWYELYENVNMEGYYVNNQWLGERFVSQINGNSIVIPSSWNNSQSYSDEPLFWLKNLDDSDIALAVCTCCEGNFGIDAIARRRGVGIRPVIGDGPQPGPKETEQ